MAITDRAGSKGPPAASPPTNLHHKRYNHHDQRHRHCHHHYHLVCDEDDSGGDNDYKAGSTRGPCCDNPGCAGAFDKILLVAIDKILGR